jgi:hypothetical protein
LGKSSLTRVSGPEFLRDAVVDQSRNTQARESRCGAALRFFGARHRSSCVRMKPPRRTKSASRQPKRAAHRSKSAVRRPKSVARPAFRVITAALKARRAARKAPSAALKAPTAMLFCPTSAPMSSALRAKRSASRTFSAADEAFWANDEAYWANGGPFCAIDEALGIDDRAFCRGDGTTEVTEAVIAITRSADSSLIRPSRRCRRFRRWRIRPATCIRRLEVDSDPIFDVTPFLGPPLCDGAVDCQSPNENEPDPFSRFLIKHGPFFPPAPFFSLFSLLTPFVAWHDRFFRQVSLI